MECVLLICGTKNLFNNNVLFKTPVRPSWYTVGMMVLLPWSYLCNQAHAFCVQLCAHIPYASKQSKKHFQLSSLIINVYSNQTVLTWLESWVFLAQEVHWVVDDEHLIPVAGSSSLSNINQTSSCYALLLYAVEKKGSYDKLVYCRTIVGTDWVNPENLGSTYGWLCTLVYTRVCVCVRACAPIEILARLL